MVRNSPEMQETWDLIPGLGRCPGGGPGNLLQCSCMENIWTEEPGGAVVHKVTKNWTRLK